MIDDAWILPEIGFDELRVHPAHLLDATDFVIVDLWRAWRGPGSGLGGGGSGGDGHLPFAGGVADQPAYLMRAFAIMDSALAAIQAALQAKRKTR